MPVCVVRTLDTSSHINLVASEFLIPELISSTRKSLFTVYSTILRYRFWQIHFHKGLTKYVVKKLEYRQYKNSIVINRLKYIFSLNAFGFMYVDYFSHILGQIIQNIILTKPETYYNLKLSEYFLDLIQSRLILFSKRLDLSNCKTTG